MYTSDIPYYLAVAAHAGTSFVPERRGEAELLSYTNHLGWVYATLQEHAQKGGTLDRLEDEFERYRAGYRKRTLAQLSSRSRCMSKMIAGPSNFPVRRMEKINGVADRRLEELLAFREYALQAAIRNLRPDLRPIMAGDADAIERLTKDIARAELMQERMKAANAAIRAKQKEGIEAQVAALIEIGFSETLAREVMKQNCFGGTGYERFELSNNKANIRRMRDRLERITKAKATPDSQVQADNGIVVDDCPADNRVRITFPGKPDADVRARLKSNGFRWTPSLGVWQAYRNYRAMSFAKELVA